mgnify:FL=1
MNKYIYIFILLITSCTKQNIYIESKLMNCVDKEYSKSIESYYGIEENVSFYKLMLEVEGILINNKLLESSKKKSYLKIFSKKKKNELALNEINTLLKDKRFDFVYSNLYSIFQSCPYKVLETEKLDNNSILSKQYEVFSLMEIEGNDNKKLIYKLIEITEDKYFENISYRAPIILLTVINLNYFTKGKREPQKVMFN